MKPIKPMSKEEKDSKRDAREELKNWHSIKLAGPPASRKSASGASYLDATNADWDFYPGVGYIHKCEQYWLANKFRQCEASGIWYPSGQCIRMHDSERYINVKFVDGKVYGYHFRSGQAIKIDKCITVYDGDGKARYALPQENTERYVGTCGIDGRKYGMQHMLQIRRPINPAYKLVSTYCVNKSGLFRECPQCGSVAEKEGVLRREDCEGRIMCHNCYSDHRCRYIIHEHNHKGYPKVIQSPKLCRLVVDGRNSKVSADEVGLGNRLYGVELETEIADGSKMTRWDLALAAMDAVGKDFLVMKNDGSLKLHARDSDLWGFEMVSAPADFPTHKERWKKLEEMQGFKHLRAWDTTTCGMHVHVGKAALTTLQIGRILAFINHKGNKKFVSKVAGRNSDAASKFIDKGFSDALVTPRERTEKYQAINTMPEHTIEFRIFRGTVRYRHIIRNMEFVDAVCDYCYPASRSLADMWDYKRFIAFVRANAKKWPLLYEWMEAQDMVPKRKLAPGQKPEEVVELHEVTTECAGAWY